MYTGVSNLSFMQSIANLFCVNLGVVASRMQYRVRCSSEASVGLLHTYLASYPLLSSKRMDYKDWAKVNAALRDGTARRRLDEMRALKDGINTGRKHFDWSHLDS